MSARLLILSPTTGRGGAEMYMLTVADAALDDGWDVVVGFESCPGTRDIVQELQARPRACYVDARIGDHGRRWAVLREGYASIRLLARVRPSAAMIVLPWPGRGLGCMLAMAFLAMPTAVIFQLAPWPVPTGGWGALARWAQRRCQQWVAVSDQNRDAVAGTFRVPPDSIRTIYNGVARTAGPGPAELTAARIGLRDELHLPAGARVVLTVGRLNSQKGHSDLLGTLPRVLKGRRDTFFIWVGDGELRPELESAIRRCDLQHHVRILGYRNDVGRLLQGSDLFLLPSRFEGHPFALVEAMAQGIPAVSSDAGGAPEIMRDQVDGLVHRREDPADLARQLSWALDHPQEMRVMADSGRCRAATFSQSRMLRETFSVLEELLAQRL